MSLEPNTQRTKILNHDDESLAVCWPTVFLNTECKVSDQNIWNYYRICLYLDPTLEGQKKMEIGIKLRTLRVSTNTPVQLICDAISKSAAQYYKYERDVHIPNADTLNKLSEFYNIGVENFFNKSLSELMTALESGCYNVNFRTSALTSK